MIVIEKKPDASWTAVYTKPRCEKVVADYCARTGITSYLPEANEPGLTRYSLSKTTLAKHEDPKIAEFFDRLRASASFERRVATWRELERYWYREQAYSVQLVGNLATIPYRSWVKGRLVGPEEIMSYMDFVTVWLDK